MFQKNCSRFHPGVYDGDVRYKGLSNDTTTTATTHELDSPFVLGQLFFSHTHSGRLALKYDQLQEMDCLVATLSVDPVKSHEEWLRDVVAHCENNIEVKFPIIGDADRKISTAFGMLDPGTSDDQDLPLTIRYEVENDERTRCSFMLYRSHMSLRFSPCSAVFIINPENKLMLSLNYPACVGRNMDEIGTSCLRLDNNIHVSTFAHSPALTSCLQFAVSRPCNCHTKSPLLRRQIGPTTMVRRGMLLTVMFVAGVVVVVSLKKMDVSALKRQFLSPLTMTDL